MNKEGLIKELEQIKNRESEIRTELTNKYGDFETWYEYGEKEHYKWLINKEQAPLFRKYFIDNGYYYWEKYSTLELDDVLDRLDDEYSEIPKDDREAMKQELMNLNFESMTYDW